MTLPVRVSSGVTIRDLNMIEYIRGTVHVNSAGGKGQTEMMRKSEWMEDLVPWM